MFYEERRPGGFWPHRDDFFVYARAPNAQELLVGIEIGTNNEELSARPDGTLLLPKGEDHLYYLVRTGQEDGIQWVGHTRLMTSKAAMRAVPTLSKLPGTV